MTHIHEKLRTHPFLVTFVVSLGLIGSNAVSLDVEAAESVPVGAACEALTEVDFTGGRNTTVKAIPTITGTSKQSIQSRSEPRDIDDSSVSIDSLIII